jgi:uncharacterized membrane protein YfcA
MTPARWLLAGVAATCLGISKAGFSGMGMIHVLIFAFLFGARGSTGIVLPMLLAGDVCAVSVFHQHARWDYIRRMLPPACLGVVLGAVLMGRLSDSVFKPIIGWIILALTAIQISRMAWPDWLGSVPHSRAVAWAVGLLTGMTTMLANAAGPIIAVYSVSVGLPKFEVVATGAWFFLIMNAVKVPFSLGLGLIQGQTLALNLVLLPCVFTGIAIGRWLTSRVPQRLFDGLLLGFAALAALRLIT